MTLQDTPFFPGAAAPPSRARADVTGAVGPAAIAAASPESAESAHSAERTAARSTRALPLIVTFVAVGVLVWCALGDADRRGGDVRAFRGSAVELPSPAEKAALLVKKDDDSIQEVPLRLSSDGEAAWLPSATDAVGLSLRVYPKALLDAKAPPAPVDLDVRVVRRRWGFIAGAAALVLFAGLVGLLGVRGQAARGRTLRAAVSRPGHGPSLARAQLLVWFAAAFAIFAATSVPLLALPSIGSSLGLLLAMSGLTAVLGAATARLATDGGAASRDPSAPRVEPPSEGVDLTRVQCLAVTLLGAVALLVAFTATMRVPEVSEGALLLVAVSQATYVATKAVRQARGR